MRIHYIQHADFEGLGSLANWAKANQHSITCTKIYAGEQLPAWQTFDILLSLGGPQSPFEYTRYSYLEVERDFIAQAINADKYVIGFCLGAQLIAEALGAKAEKSPYKEVGMFPIRLTTAGINDPILKYFPAEFKVFHWHNDMPGVPQGAEILATSDGCPRQIFRISDKVYGFQCHFEPTRDNVISMAKADAAMLGDSKYTQTVEQMLAEDYTTMNALASRFFDGLLTDRRQ